LNADLGNFISTIYDQRFSSEKSHTRETALWLASLSNYDSNCYTLEPSVLANARHFLMAVLQVFSGKSEHAPLFRGPETDLPCEPRTTTHHLASLTLIKLKADIYKAKFSTYEAQVQLEAEFAVSLVTLLQNCAPQCSIFVVTPHRFQRETVKRRMQAIALNVLPGSVMVETVERLQGSEADFVICLFSSLHPSPSDLNFLLERRRLNVAISRTKMLCIILSSEQVLNPTAHILANEEVIKGYDFLKAYERRSWTWEFLADSKLLQ
ncbi:hypothetical protein GALMADRAFT_74351, partial [Galerina marginata CBS 339.88]